METYLILTLNQHLLAAEFQSRLSFKSRLYQILPPGCSFPILKDRYESFSDVGEIRVWWKADFQSGSRVLKKVF